MRIDSIRIIRAARGEDRPHNRWAAALSDPAWQTGAKVLKQHGASWVRRATIDGRDVVIKCRPLATFWARAKCALGYGRGDRHWRGAAWLASKKIRTAKPYLLAQARIDGRLCELLIMEALNGPTLLELMDQVNSGVGPPVRVQHRIARAVALQHLAIVKNGCWNRDHKPSNVIVEHADVFGADVSLIDCVGLRCEWPLMSECCDEMLACLIIEPIGCSCAPRLALQMRVLRTFAEADPAFASRKRRHRAMRSVIDGVTAELAGHGDPRPKVHPLAQSPAPTSS